MDELKKPRRRPVELTDEAWDALADLRVIIGYSGEDEAEILSRHVCTELATRVAKLKK